MKWVVRQFKKRCLLPLLRPANDSYYAPFFRLFYQNLRYDTEAPTFLSSTIFYQHIYVGVSEIADAINCPSDDPSGRFGEYPPHCDLHFIVTSKFGGIYGDSKSTCIKIAQLPPSLLLVDSVLKRNVCPLGHKAQRIGDILTAFYVFEEKYWVNIPELIWKQLHKCWEDMIEKRLVSASQRPLPFPCLITKLTIDNGIPILERVPIDMNIPVFGITQRKHSDVVFCLPKYINNKINHSQ
jgi:hypothetical protein